MRSVGNQQTSITIDILVLSYYFVICNFRSAKSISDLESERSPKVLSGGPRYFR